MTRIDKLKKPVTILFILLMIISLMYLRFKDLGYSDYVDDEHSTFLLPSEMRKPLVDFLLNQRKGPMQNFVSELPYLITRDFRNELAERIPYALINLVALAVLYKALSIDLRSKRAAFLAAVFLGVNGLNVCFGRIVQYQNLNMLFSFSALYFFVLFEQNPLKLKYSLLGTLMVCLSIYSHWDAIFIFFPILWIVGGLLLTKMIPWKLKFKVALANIFLALLVLLPFFVPYVISQLNSQSNQNYLDRRIGGAEKDLNLQFIYELYNPLYSLQFFAVLVVLSIPIAIYKPKYRKYLFWLVGTTLIFVYFVEKPGTHIYNIVIPAIILAAIFMDTVFSIRINKVKPVLLTFQGAFAVLLLCAYIFFWYQSNTIFVDHTLEYPWQQKLVYKTLVPQNLPDKILPLFGFPHSRQWNKIHEFVDGENARLNESFGYTTNEDIAHARFYIDAENRPSGGFYYIVIKNPISFIEDWGAYRHTKKTKVLELTNEKGEVVVKVYKVRDSRKT